MKMLAPDLRGRNVLVAGGAGFVGSAIVIELLKLGSNVVVYDNFLHGHRQHLDEVKERIEIVAGDILDPWRLSETMRKHDIEFVIDCVGDTYVPTVYDMPGRFIDINIKGTFNLLMACKEKVKRILYVSSTEVYGEARSKFMNESHPFWPGNTYAVTKLAADHLCRTLSEEQKIPVVIGRIFNSYGPRETEPYVVPEIICQLDKKDVLHLGNIKARRDFTYVHDTADALIKTLCSGLPDGDSVNIGSGIAYSVEEIAKKLMSIMGKSDAAIVIDEKRLRVHDIEYFCCDNTKLRKYTGWSPTVNIEEGLRLTVDWYRKHGSKWCWEDWVEGTLMMR